MFALVTGGTGFIGSNLVKRLLRDGWRVRLLSRKVGRLKNVDWIIGDVTDKKVIEKAVSGVDIIFNLAGALPYHRTTDKIFWDTNVKGVENILKACLGKTVKRIVHVSTVGIYGSTGNNVFSEKSKMHLDSIYAKTKAKGEELVMDYFKKYKLPVVVIRPTIGYGYFDTRPGFLNLFRLLKKGWFIPLGNGENFFHTVYAGNLVDALLLAASKKEAVGEDFIIGDDPCPKMRDILKEMAKITGCTLPPFYLPLFIIKPLARLGDILQSVGLKVPIYSQRINFLTENRRYSIEKAKKILKFYPKVNLTDGVKMTYLWYRKKGLV